MFAINSQNLEFSNFPIIVNTLYNTMASKDSRIRRTLPFCMFQHYLCEILNAVLLSRVIEQNSDERFKNERDPYDIINMKNMMIPTPFVDYINGITSVVIQGGDKIFFNLPDGGVPQERIDPQIKDTTVVRCGLPSGSFGACVKDNHNEYECYVSPYITKRLIEKTIEVNSSNERLGPWNLLPAGYFPTGFHCTKNLLGYAEPERLNAESLNAFQDIRFTDSNTMAGRLCHSMELISKVNLELMRYANNFKMCVGVPPPSISPACIIFTAVTDHTPHNERLADVHGHLYSVESFGSAAANMAGYFTYKKKS